MVSNAVGFVLVIEFALMFLSVMLFLRPNGLFGSGKEKKTAFSAWSGVFFLFLTFIWSVITGIILAMNDLYLRW